jgi:alpha-glucosidase
MPMMQFSVAPWRILDKPHLEAVKKAVGRRLEFTPLIMKLAHEASLSGEPILKSMEYVFPGQGFEETIDQFMLGNNILVAPVLTKGNTRKVKLPEGKWEFSDGKIYKGGRTIELNVSIDDLPYFKLTKI